MSEEIRNKESKGFGDTIAKVTSALGLDKVAERKEKLNDLFPYNK